MWIVRAGWPVVGDLCRHTLTGDLAVVESVNTDHYRRRMKDYTWTLRYIGSGRALVFTNKQLNDNFQSFIQAGVS